MAVDAILQAVAGVIDGVEGSGRVYAYERWSARWGSFLELFKDGGKIAGWQCMRSGMSIHRQAYGELWRCHVIRLRAMRSLKDEDATDLDFQAHLDAVADAFLADETLGGSVETIFPEVGPMTGVVGMEILDVQNRVFGDVLCHTAEGRVCCVEGV